MNNEEQDITRNAIRGDNLATEVQELRCLFQYGDWDQISLMLSIFKKHQEWSPFFQKLCRQMNQDLRQIIISDVKAQAQVLRALKILRIYQSIEGQTGQRQLKQLKKINNACFQLCQHVLDQRIEDFMKDLKIRRSIEEIRKELGQYLLMQSSSIKNTQLPRFEKIEQKKQT